MIKRYGMKKPVSTLFVLIAALFVSCGLNPAPEGDGAPDGGDDGGSRRELPRYVTMRLADYGEYVSDSIGIGIGAGNVVSTPVSSRALTFDNAQASHDFFEAVFYYSTNAGNTTVARAAWDIGATPELRGVYRTTVGVNYGNVGMPPPTGQGSAVLFVGSKADKTLLAVGKLIEVGGSSGTTISESTKSVTFEVTALRAGVAPNRAGAINSSFKTYSGWTAPGTVSGETTDLTDGIYLHYVDKREFPFFNLRTTPSNVNYGAYTFNTAAGDTTFTDYAAGIVLAGERNFEARNPRYIITNGQYQYSSLLVQDVGMTHGGNLDMMNNNVRLGQPVATPYNPVTGPQYFTNPVVFKIDTSASLPTTHTTATVFALTFEIFVNNLTAVQTSPLTGGAPPEYPKPVTWRISTGIGTKWLDLDDGKGGDGGAVFLGTGDAAAYLNQAGNMPRP